MKTITRNAQWLSDVYNVPAGDPPWTSRSTILETKLRKIDLDSTSSTTSLVTYDNVDIQAGDTLLIRSSSDPTYSQEITVEGVTESGGDNTASIDLQRSFKAEGSVLYSPFALYFNSSPVRVANGFGQNWKFSDDGTRAWVTGPLNQAAIQQIELAEPFNLNSVYSTSGTFALTESNGVGWTFANNGRYLYVSAYIRNYACNQFFRYTLDVPYDISTAKTPTDHYSTALDGGADNLLQTAFAFNEDGTRFITYRATTGIVRWGVCTTPWDLNTFALTGSSSQGQIPFPCFTDDGKYMIKYFDDIASIGSFYIRIYDMSDNPAIFNSAYEEILFSTIPEITTEYLFPTTANNNLSPICFDRNLKHFSLLTVNNSTNRLLALQSKYGKKKVIDISTQGLASVPENGYLYIAQKPSLKYSVSPGSYASVMNERLAMWGSTTTTAKIVSDSENLFNVGDTVLLNNTTPVTINSVSKSTATRGDLTSLAGKIYNQGVAFVGSTAATGNLGRSPTFYITPDGSKLFIAASTLVRLSGMYIYDLSIPWDISTAEPATVPYVSTADLYRLSTGLNNVVLYNDGAFGPNQGLYDITSFDFSPDGLTLNIHFFLSTRNSYIRSYVLEKPWDILSMTSMYARDTFQGTNNTSYTYINSSFFNPDGTEYYIVETLTSNNYTYYFQSSPVAPYLGASNIYTSISFTATGDRRGMWRFTPDGKKVVNLGFQGYFGNANAFVSNIHPATVAGSFGTAIGAATEGGIPNDSSFDMAGQFFTDHRFSNNGLHYYLMTNTGNLHQYDVKTVDTLTEYDISFDAQGSAPTSVWLPDNSASAVLSISSFATTATTNYADVTYSVEDETIPSTNSLRIKLDGVTSTETEIDTIRVDLL